MNEGLHTSYWQVDGVEVMDIFIIENDQVLARASLCNLSNQTPLIENIYVHPDYRGKSYSGKLVAFAFGYCIENFKAGLQTFVRDNNEHGIDALHRLGFKPFTIIDYGTFSKLGYIRRIEQVKA